MATIQLVTFVALALCLASAQPFLPGLQVLPYSKGYIKEPLTLTCAVNFTDKYKPNAGIVNAIAVTIKEKQGLYGGAGPALFPYLNGKGGSQGYGLSASINIFSLIGGPVSIAFTERARPERGCYAEDFGSFYTGLPPAQPYRGFGGYGGVGSSYGGLNGLGGLGGGFNGLGGLGGYGSGLGSNYGMGGQGYGLGGQGYGPDGQGYGLGGQGYGMGGQGYGMGGQGYGGPGPMGGAGPIGGAGYSGVIYTERAPGIVANIRLTPGTASEINIDTLSGFSSLKDLAGRGIVVCPDAAVGDKYGEYVCENGILSCCALHYDNGEQKLTVSYNY
ncbi:spidroin-1-like [Biomphalaria glabrata]|uniref:Spidroin-1-like n=1 Tax=Biomphalaria glabrata TaxID=6526 RepID=A0A2C9M9I9_BIOGL|nr:spidroin-1-like [Biomphalaria glabrata]